MEICNLLEQNLFEDVKNLIFQHLTHDELLKFSENGQQCFYATESIIRSRSKFVVNRSFGIENEIENSIAKFRNYNHIEIGVVRSGYVPLIKRLLLSGEYLRVLRCAIDVESNGFTFPMLEKLKLTGHILENGLLSAATSSLKDLTLYACDHRSLNILCSFPKLKSFKCYYVSKEFGSKKIRTIKNLTDITLCAKDLQWSIIPLFKATPNLQTVKIKSPHDVIRDCLEAFNENIPGKVETLTLQLAYQDRKGMDIGLFDEDFWRRTLAKKNITLNVLAEKLLCCPYHACCVAHWKPNVDYYHGWNNFEELLEKQFKEIRLKQKQEENILPG